HCANTRNVSSQSKDAEWPVTRWVQGRIEEGMAREPTTGGGEQGRQPCQPHPGTRRYRYGCPLPGPAGLAANRCEGTDRVAITNPTDAGRAIVTACPQVTSRFFSCNQTGMCGIGHPPADERWPAGVGILSRYH